MPTFRKRNGKWNVRIREYYGARPISQAFATKVEAKRWAAKTEAELDASGRVFDFTQSAVREVRGREAAQTQGLEIGAHPWLDG